MNGYAYCLGDPVRYIDPEGLEIRVYSSDAWGIGGLNHAWIYSTETGQSKGMNGSSGYVSAGTGGGNLHDPYRTVDMPCGVSEEEFMNRILDGSWETGLWFPWLTLEPYVGDCHARAEWAIEGAGAQYPGAPNGRIDWDDDLLTALATYTGLDGVFRLLAAAQ